MYLNNLPFGLGTPRARAFGLSVDKAIPTHDRDCDLDQAFAYSLAVTQEVFMIADQSVELFVIALPAVSLSASCKVM